MAIIKLKNIGKCFNLENNHFFRGNREKTFFASDKLEEFWALKDISFEVERAEVLGIIGRNGAGKTTLLKIISGIISPTEGDLLVEGRVFGLFTLGIGFQEELTGRENIFLNGTLLGVSKSELEKKLNTIIDFSELGDFVDMPLGTYSQGMRFRLGFAIVANLECDILVIDEILAVGDLLFQNKCLNHFINFRRLNKTLIICSQNMELIERFCDRVVLLDHGRILFQGNVQEGINKYQGLLNREKFYVGPSTRGVVIENTKKWAEDASLWGSKIGSKEVVIKKVEFINRFGLRCSRIKTSQPLRIKVYFKTKNTIKDPHFGVAIFREDGVYCYGPNTKFDRIEIPELKQGNGFFILEFFKFFLAPGIYLISIAIWDKNENLAFDYHPGLYKLIVDGYNNSSRQLFDIPFKILDDKGEINFFNSKFIFTDEQASEKTINEKNKINSFDIESIKFLDFYGSEKTVIFTNETVRLIINFKKKLYNKGCFLWIGLYRDDNIYCQGINISINCNKRFVVLFPKFSFLPGRYYISVGIFDKIKNEFITRWDNFYYFRVVYDKLDHGTIFLEHRWRLGGEVFNEAKLSIS